MKKNASLLSILLLISFESCTNGSHETETHSVKDSITTYQTTDTLALLQSTCFSCHNPDMDCNNRLAPPLFKIREHYLTETMPKEKFVNAIWKFVQNPSEELSIMPGAVRNFNLMPKQNFNEPEVKTIASYLFDNDVSGDDWYEKWNAYIHTKK